MEFRILARNTRIRFRNDGWGYKTPKGKIAEGRIIATMIPNPREILRDFFPYYEVGVFNAIRGCTDQLVVMPDDVVEVLTNA